MLQGLRLQWFSLAVLALGLYWSSSIEGLRFVPIYEALNIKIHRDSPPHVAFEEIYEVSNLSFSSSGYHTINLSDPQLKALPPRPQFELPVMTLSHSKNTSTSEGSYSAASSVQASQWRETLTPAQKARIEKAQIDKNLLDQDWNPPSWSELVAKKLKESGVLQEDAPPPVRVIGHNSSERSRPTVEYSNVPSVNGSSHQGPSVITGAFEVSGGLGYTNEHGIEVHRVSNGEVQEIGTVDVKDGKYTISVNENTGDLVALIRSEDGTVIGKGIASLDGAVAVAPTIKASPTRGVVVLAASPYNPDVAESAPKGTKVSFLGGESVIAANKQGRSELANSVEGASTLARITSKGHLQTNLLAISGQETSVEVFPESMMAALVDIVNSQRNMEFESRPSIIWGRVKGLNKSGMTGIQVMLESAPYLEPIYFNDLMLPDLNLKATGSTGLFAFIGTSEGLHSLAAYRDNQLYGYQNTVVEEGVVSVANIEVSSSKHNSYIRVYDAFSGVAQESTLTVQALAKEVLVDGEMKVETSQVSRLGFLKSVPTLPDYLPSRYIFNELQRDIYIPLISWNWLNTLKNTMKFPDAPSAGSVVGFVPSQDYDVFIAGIEDLSSYIVYFDSQGRALQSPHGVAGGGFVLFNLPSEISEVIVIGKTSNKIDSRVVPVDANSLHVLTFISN